MKFSDTLITFFFWCHTGVLESDLLLPRRLRLPDMHFVFDCVVSFLVSLFGCGLTSA